MNPIDEQHYTPQQLGKLWGFSSRFILRTFRDEPGVLKVIRPERMNKRSYTSIRIPASVARRVYARLIKDA